jgi:hypothetical protein
VAYSKAELKSSGDNHLLVVAILNRKLVRQIFTYTDSTLEAMKLPVPSFPTHSCYFLSHEGLDAENQGVRPFGYLNHEVVVHVDGVRRCF